MPAAASLSIAFGEVLRALRREHGISQEQLGFACGRHRTYISALERGTSSPTLDTLWVVTAALEVDPSEFVRQIEARKPPVAAPSRSDRSRRSGRRHKVG